LPKIRKKENPAILSDSGIFFGEGQAVCFDITQGPKGDQAINVSDIEIIV